MRVPVLETGRLLLRTYVQEDMDALFLMVSDPDVRRFFADPTWTREEMWASYPRRMEFWRKNGFGQFGVFGKESDKLVGYCGLKPLEDTKEIEIYYGFFRDSWGNGYATESATAVLRFAFEDAGLERVIGVTHTENYASQKVLEKIGLNREGTAFHYDMDVFYYALPKANYTAPAPMYSLSWKKIDG
jgi:ribosomal-protein-alanine N-acetyltransferase